MGPGTASPSAVIGSVGRRVRSAYRIDCLIVAAESTIVGGSAVIAALAAAKAAGADTADPQCVALLVLAFGLAAASWWLERREDLGSIARALDRRAGLRGGLFTAYEAESAARRSPLAQTLALRVAPAASAGGFLGTRIRASAGILAAPFLALALFGAVSAGRSSPHPARTSAVLQQLGHLRNEAARSADSPHVAPDAAAELRALVQLVDAVRSRAADPRTPAADLERETAELSRRIRAASEPGAGPRVAPDDPEGRMEDPDPRIDRHQDDPMREPASPTPPEPSPSGNSPPADPWEEGGVGASRWWPGRYDGVVDRWIEARRAASGEPPR